MNKFKTNILIMDLESAKPIEITDKDIFDEYFRKFPPEISEFTFTNLFIWRNYYEFQFLEWKEHLLVFSKRFFKEKKQSVLKNPDTIFFMPPIGLNPSQLMLDLFEIFRDLEFHRVPESITEDIKQNPNASSMNIEILDDPNNWDYVYEKSALIELAGKKLRKKRQWLNRFKEAYEFEFHLISKEWIGECRKLQLEWCDMNDCKLHEDLIEEQKAVDEAFENYDTLDFAGGLIYIDGKCVAYTLGELLNSTTMVIHIEKAHKFYEGSYQAINNFFCNECCKNADFINREQDLGDAGLRQAKKSYYPIKMVKKYIVFINKN